MLFVGRTRYRLPLEPAQARKWQALAEVFELRVLGTGTGSGAHEFVLVPESGGLLGFYGLLPRRIARELRDFRAHAIVAQSPYEAAAALAGRRLARSRAKVLLEVHGDWGTATRLYGSPRRRLLEPLSRRVARAAVRRGDAVRTVSPFTTRLVREFGVEPAATFTTYFDVSPFLETPPVSLPDGPRALFVGVIERYKNVAGLVEAWRIVQRRLPAATLHVVGRGREHAEIERLVADCGGGVTWTESLPSAGVAAALDAAALLVLPSFSEGLPRVAMEAFCRGRPVVGSRAGGIPDIVEDGVNGVLVPAGDASTLADALVRVLSDRELLERLAAGARESAARWVQTPEQFAQRFRDLVERMLA